MPRQQRKQRKPSPRTSNFSGSTAAVAVGGVVALIAVAFMAFSIFQQQRQQQELFQQMLRRVEAAFPMARKEDQEAAARRELVRQAEFERVYGSVAEESLATSDVWHNYAQPFAEDRSCLAPENAPPEELVSRVSELAKAWRTKMATLDADAKAKLLETVITNATYHSNAIEGNRLSLTDTTLVVLGLPYDATKLFKDDVREAQNLAEVLRARLFNHVNLSTQSIRDINRIVRRGLDEFHGRWRLHNVAAGRSVALLPMVQEVPRLMDQYSQWIESLLAVVEDSDVRTVLAHACHAHYAFIHIHPFIDGNGRTARVIDSEILTSHDGLPPAIFPVERREEYIAAMNDALDRRYHRPLCKLHAEVVASTLEAILHLL